MCRGSSNIPDLQTRIPFYCWVNPFGTLTCSGHDDCLFLKYPDNQKIFYD